jgi:hypothetical protein
VKLRRIVSGGQTGVDRGALDAALEAGFPCGGWCPQGRRAEDGIIPARYPVNELGGAGYRQRTLRNVLDSDATLIIAFGPTRGGTELTRRFCRENGIPCRVIDATTLTPGQAAPLIAGFVSAHDIATLNVAGPRESQAPAACAYTREVMRLFLSAQEGACGERVRNSGGP